MAEVDAEARCLEALDRGDHAGAATVLVSEYGPQLLGYLCSVLRIEADAGDVFSMFSEVLWRGLPGFRCECPVRVWCYRLAWHAAAHFLRDPYRGRGRRLETTALSRLVEEVRSSVFLGRDQARQATLDRLREGLSPDQRRLALSSFDGTVRMVGLDAAGAGDSGEPLLLRGTEGARDRRLRFAARRRHLHLGRRRHRIWEPLRAADAAQPPHRLVSPLDNRPGVT
jgi:RNA polymerase sigma-70 factor (ECF subfamily)